MGLPLTGMQRLTEWSPGYRLVHQISGAICYVGGLSIHVPCMQPPLETLTLTSLSASKVYLLVPRLNALYTPLTWIPRVLGLPPISDVLTDN